jgi:tetratricopeptide (TPR) repeat protein
LEIDDADLTHLFVRKSTILCSLGFFESAKDFAQQAIDILESSMAYYRLAIAQYCLKEYDYALETLLLATNLDGLNFHIQHALQVVLTRIRSRKDRPDLFEEDHE